MSLEWRLQYPGVDFAFGECESGYILDKHPQQNPRTFDVQDRRMPGADSRAFGRDTLAPGPLTFPRISVRGATEEETRRKRSYFSAVWRADSLRDTPGAVAMMRAPSGRYAFGRPRRFAANDEWLSQRLSAVVADFEMSDERWFDEADIAKVPYTPPLVGGLVAPLTAPLTTDGPSTVEAREAVVGGELPTPFQLLVKGPMTNGVVVLTGPLGHTMRFYITGGLISSQVLELDTRPEVRTVTINGRPAGNRLSARSTRLSEATLRPGTYVITFEGSSSDGNAYAELRWRNAYGSW